MTTGAQKPRPEKLITGNRRRFPTCLRAVADGRSRCSASPELLPAPGLPETPGRRLSTRDTHRKDFARQRLPCPCASRLRSEHHSPRSPGSSTRGAAELAVACAASPARAPRTGHDRCLPGFACEQLRELGRARREAVDHRYGPADMLLIAPSMPIGEAGQRPRWIPSDKRRKGGSSSSCTCRMASARKIPFRTGSLEQTPNGSRARFVERGHPSTTTGPSAREERSECRVSGSTSNRGSDPGRPANRLVDVAAAERC